MTFEEWKDGYGLVLEPNYSKETEADCLAAFNFGKRESAVLIERQAAQIEMMQEALGYRIDHPKVITALSFIPNQALEQFAAKVREQCAVIAETPVSGEQDDITMQAKDRVASAIRTLKELP